MQPERIERGRLAGVRTRPEFHQLAIFLKVVETRSFAATARLMGCTQPAISQAIARLEDVYGGDLFERRRGAPLALTPVGEAILPSARTVLYTVDEQMERAARTAQSHAGTLTLGFYPGLAAGPLRAGIADFIAASPEVRLRLVEGGPGDLHRYLIERTIDLMIVALMPDLADGTLVQEQLWDEQLFVALPAHRDLARLPELDWPAVAAMPLILSTSNGEACGLTSLLATLAGRNAQCRQHEVSRDALLDMVGIGIGVSIVFGSTVVPHRDVVFRPIAGENASVPIEAIWRKRDANPLRHRLLHHIRQRASDAGGRASLSALFPATAPAPDRG